MPRPDDVGVGTALFVFRYLKDENDIERRHLLLGKRKGAHAAGHWACPGGWLDRIDDETSKACARELFEETGIVANPAFIQAVGWTTEDMPELNARTVTLYHEVWVTNGEPRVIEPDKCEEWRWFPLNNLPRPLFPGVEKFVSFHYPQ